MADVHGRVAAQMWICSSVVVKLGEGNKF